MLAVEWNALVIAFHCSWLCFVWLFCSLASSQFSPDLKVVYHVERFHLFVSIFTLCSGPGDIQVAINTDQTPIESGQR